MSDEHGPVLDAQTLRLAGRSPPVPFRVQTTSGSVIQIVRLLRVLPGKRIVGEGHANGEHVLVKLFIAHQSNRHWRRERDGVAALDAAAVPTPEVLGSDTLAGGGHLLLTRFLDGAVSLAERWERSDANPPGNPGAVAAIAPGLDALARMHAAGLTQEDLHLGNFLAHDEGIFVIDGDGVRARTPGRPLSETESIRNLAILLAQLPAEWDGQLDRLLAGYTQAHRALNNFSALRRAIAEVRTRRLSSFLAKTVRDCSLFSVVKSPRRFTSITRDAVPWLAALVADPDAALSAGSWLKDGRTASVARVGVQGQDVVVKRYNLKSPAHALSRLWRPSRAWHSWREAHRLCFLGIATPRPLAMVEDRIGPLRRRAWLITENCPGVSLQQHLDPDHAPPPSEAQAIATLFATLHRERITHGDLKATNLLWHEGRIHLIDLDAMVQHRSAASHDRAWRRDRARLLRNWAEDCPLHAWLDENLPPAG